MRRTGSDVPGLGSHPLALAGRAVKKWRVSQATRGERMPRRPAATPYEPSIRTADGAS